MDLRLIARCVSVKSSHFEGGERTKERQLAEER